MENVSSNLSTVNVIDFEGSDEAWDYIVNNAPQAWCWHTRAWHSFIKSASEKMNFQDHSFFILKNNRPICLVPMATCDIQYENGITREAGYYGGPLPWPCALYGEVTVEKYAIEEAERRARSAGAGRMSFMSSSPFVKLRRDEWFDPILASLGYIDISFDSHLVLVDKNLLGNVRKTYRKQVARNKKSIETKIMRGALISEELTKKYLELHVKDAGGQFRSYESYRCQTNLVRQGEGFFVVASDVSSKKIVGMLLISIVKGAAYDNSVAVDPEFQNAGVSHIMKWRTIEELVDMGISHYELGMIFNTPKMNFIPSANQRGISFFKSGWSRDSSKKIFVAEKCLDISSFNQLMDRRISALKTLFKL